MIMLIVIFAVIISFDCYPQDIRSPRPVINTNDTILARSQTRFIKAWNWSSIDRKLDSAMFMNSYHRNADWNISNLPQSYQFPINQWRIQAFSGYNGIGCGDMEYSMLQAPAIEYCPAITFYTQANFNPNQFTPLDGDNEGYIFGFKNIDLTNGSIPSSSPNKNTYVLNKTNIINPTIVLSEPWPDNELISLDNVITDTLRNGTRYLITINLKSLETINSSNEDLPVLTIKVPYYLYNNSTKYYVDFSKEPSNGFASSDTLTIFSVRGNPDRRGFARKLINKTSDFEEIVITGKMLKVNAAGLPDSNITLCGFFILDPVLSNNPKLQIDEYKAGKIPNRISHLGIEVTYHGNINIAINVIKFETPYAQSLLRGQQDSAFADTLRSRMNMLRNLRSGLRIHRFYGIDEFWVQNWLSHRYFNKLVDGLATSEMDHNIYTNLFEHFVDFPEYWRGRMFSISPTVAAPYFRKTNRNINNFSQLIPEVFNYVNGYTGFWYTNSNYLRDTINSEYETYIIKQYGGNGWHFEHVSLPLNEPVNIFEHLDYSNPTPFYLSQSVQMSFERELYNLKIAPFFLYSSKSWWTNVWSSSETWKGHVNPDSLYYRPEVGSRAKTGEEIRFQTNLPLILGAKGLIYWWGTTDYSYGGGNASIGMASFFSDLASDHLSMPMGKELLNSDMIGGDFINVTGDSSYITEYLNTSNILFDTLGHSSNRIYLGRKSVRNEVAKINQWIDATQETLLKLKLACWYAKGFTTWYNQDTARFGTNELISKFIDLDANKLFTKKLFSVNPSTMEYVPQISPESNDSMFADLTILRDTSNNEMDKYFILGLQNRRTDPLVLWDWDSAGTKKQYMRFLSTAEFEDSCHTGTDSLKFQDLYWKRLACREFHIPFKYRNSIKSNEWTTLRVTELGYDDTTLNKQPWRDKKYY